MGCNCWVIGLFVGLRTKLSDRLVEVRLHLNPDLFGERPIVTQSEIVGIIHPFVHFDGLSGD